MAKYRSIPTILKALMKNPRASDRRIAQIVRTSQPTVTRARTFLEESKLMRFAAIPQYQDLGYSIMAISEIVIMDEDKRVSTSNTMKNDTRIIAVFESLRGFVLISIHKDFLSCITFLREYGLTTNFLVDIKTGIVKDFDFSDL